MQNDKISYICGPLTELPVDLQKLARDFYTSIADFCEEVINKRAFVPHEHYDPKKHFNFSPADVDKAERKQVCENTSLLIVVAIAPSWGGGIEVEMACRSNVPVIILCEKGKKISHLLLGNPSVRHVIFYQGPTDALRQLRKCLEADKILVDIVTGSNQAREKI